MIIDNGNVHAVSKDDRWTPKLDGDVYCSPACGGRCKKAVFDQVSERALAIATMLGAGWEPRVWENLGWHFDVRKGLAIVSSKDEGAYQATLQFNFDGRSSDYFEAVRSSPREAVKAVHAEVNARITALKRALLSVSLEVVEIEFDSLPQQIKMNENHGD